MALKHWFVDLRSIPDEAEYLRVFDLLEKITEGSGLMPTRRKRVFTCLLDAEENAVFLRGLNQYLYPEPPEM